MTLPDASLSLRALARLLSYPDETLRGQLPEIRDALKSDRTVAADRLAELGALINTLERGDALDNEAEYLQIFDRGRSTSLHLFEHVHGDSRDVYKRQVQLRVQLLRNHRHQSRRVCRGAQDEQGGLAR